MRQIKELKKQAAKLAQVMAELSAWDCLADAQGATESEFPDPDERKQKERMVQHMVSPEVKAEIERIIREQVSLRSGAAAGWAEPTAGAAPAPPPAALVLGITATPSFGGA